MFQFPPIPSWDAMHPLIIHFPIALLLLTPLFVVISAAVPPAKSRPYILAALIVLFLGTGGLFLAASSGEEAAELADRAGGAGAVLSAHEALATKTEVVFSVLSVALAGIFLWPILLRRRESRVTSTILPLVFLALYSVGVSSLVNTAHAGGRLVHEFGVHALLPHESSATGASTADKLPANPTDAD